MKCFLTEPVEIGCSDELINLQDNIINSILIDRAKQINSLILSNLYKITPKIKGELTKGKFKWRGVKIIIHDTFLTTTIWIEQRGKKISEDITFNNEISFS